MKRVILCSPYAGDIERNIKYARECMRDSLSRGEAPIASHLLYTQDGILNDNDPVDRQKGIEAGLAWGSVAEGFVFYTDYGLSKGMSSEMDFAIENGIYCEVRRIHNKPTNDPFCT